MNTVHLMKNAKFIARIFYPRHYALCSNFKRFSVCSRYKVIKSSYFNVPKEVKFISNCSSMQTKDSDSPNDKNSNDKIHKILEDDEFQNILKDFANDFGVDGEANDLLDDIRKNINGDNNENSLSKENCSKVDNPSTALGGGLDNKYKEFSDADSSVILSYEERNRTFEITEEIYHIDQELKFKPYTNFERGITGVFDIDDIIQVLRNESLLDIVAISMPADNSDYSYDFFILVTAKSQRHIEAVSETIIKLYKKKKNKSDPFITVEGAKNSGWSVIDMGNIVLHIFLDEVRAKYDIESCQLFDFNFDSGGNMKTDPMLKVMEEQMEFFNSLQQSKSPEVSKENS